MFHAQLSPPIFLYIELATYPDTPGKKRENLTSSISLWGLKHPNDRFISHSDQSIDMINNNRLHRELESK